VSSCIPWVPRMRDTAVTSRGWETDSQSSRFSCFDSVAVGRGFRNANRDVHVLGPSISLARNWPRRSQRSETAIRGTTT